MKRIFRVLILLFIIILFIFLFNFFINKESNNTENSQYLPKEEKIAQDVKSDVSFTLTAIGDIMCHNTQYWDAYQKDTDTYDFSYVFENVKDYISAGDISIANIETKPPTTL